MSLLRMVAGLLWLACGVLFLVNAYYKARIRKIRAEIEQLSASVADLRRIRREHAEMN